MKGDGLYIMVYLFKYCFYNPLLYWNYFVQYCFFPEEYMHCTDSKISTAHSRHSLSDHQLFSAIWSTLSGLLYTEEEGQTADPMSNS